MASASPLSTDPSSNRTAGISSVPTLRRISSRSAGSTGTGIATNDTPSSVSFWRTLRE